MKVLVIGGGGREHAIAWKLSHSSKLTRMYAYPMNGGLAQLTERTGLQQGASSDEIAQYVEKEGIDLTIVGPEAMLCGGIVDVFQSRGLKIFGPNRQAAQLEGSKVWAKRFLQKYNVPCGEGCDIHRLR